MISGTEEEYGEREMLLGELTELGAENEKKEKKMKDEKKDEQGDEVRKAAIATLKEQSIAIDDNGESTSKKRKKSNLSADYVKFLKEKNDREMDLKKEQLELEKAKFECERKEREART
ncbi:uncharacterized protein LOC126832706, partial [Patella vulgata]|uniref:uncharacterized protein LOC126832706 n=1 Tax=Patella vulgata TaxID=6465 RepID=UPI0024A8F5BB